jgi:hypothetical protein
MRILSGAVVVFSLLALPACQTGTTGGPGASDVRNEPLVGRPDESFNLQRTKAELRQGETKSVAIAIDRTRDFDDDVTLDVEGLPRGLTIDNKHPVIKHGDAEARFMLTAADDASLGDFTLKVTGHPTKGTDAMNELKVTVDRK